MIPASLAYAGMVTAIIGAFIVLPRKRKPIVTTAKTSPLYGGKGSPSRAPGIR